MSAKDLLRVDVVRFGELFAAGTEKIEEACRLYVKQLNKSLKARKDFAEAYPTIPKEAWSRFEEVGRGVLRRELIYATGSVGAKLRALPYSEQSRVIDRGVKFLTAEGDTLTVKADALTPEMALQMIAPGGLVRTLAQQRAWRESQKARKQREKPAIGSYSVIDGKLVVTGPLTLDRKELLTALQEMM